MKNQKKKTLKLNRNSEDKKQLNPKELERLEELREKERERENYERCK